MYLTAPCAKIKRMRLALALLLFLLGTPEALAKKKPPTLAQMAVARVTESFVTAPIDQEVCFSPEGNCDVKLWKFIQSAKVSLDVAVFDITHDKIAHEIMVASKRIPVRVITDRRQSKGQYSVVSTMIKAGVDVRIGKQRGIMHNKFCLVDGKMVQTGSFNYTDGASTKNNENQIYLSNPGVVAQYRSRFDALWAEATPASKLVSRP